MEPLPIIAAAAEEDKKKPTRIATRNGNITILGDDNFRDWKWHLKFHLKALDLYDAVVTKDYPDIRKDEEAMYEIICTLSDKIKCRVSHCSKAYELYGTIESIYSNKTAFSLTELNMRLTNYKFKNIDQINQGISVIQTIVGKIKNLGESVSDRMLEGILLAALPPSFKTFVTVWKGVTESERTVQNLINRIQAEAEDMKTFAKDDKALFAKPGNGYQSHHNNNRNSRRGNYSNRGNNNYKNNHKGHQNTNSRNSGHYKNIFCSYCKKKGHIKDNCRKLLAKQSDQSGDNKNNHKGNGNSGHHSSGNNKGPTNEVDKPVSFMAHESLGDSTLWVADSGASRHMTSHREWFNDYYKFETPVDIMPACDGALQAFGSGSIKTTAGILDSVYYVPQIRANLFSIGSAAKRGIKVAYDEEIGRAHV